MSAEGDGYHFTLCSVPSGGPHGLVSKAKYDSNPPPGATVLVAWPGGNKCAWVDVNSTGYGLLFSFSNTAHMTCSACMDANGETM